MKKLDVSLQICLIPPRLETATQKLHFLLVSESQIRRLYSRFAHLDKRSKGYLM